MPYKLDFTGLIFDKCTIVKIGCICVPFETSYSVQNITYAFFLTCVIVYAIVLFVSYLTLVIPYKIDYTRLPFDTCNTVEYIYTCPIWPVSYCYNFDCTHVLFWHVSYCTDFDSRRSNVATWYTVPISIVHLPLFTHVCLFQFWLYSCLSCHFSLCTKFLWTRRGPAPCIVLLLCTGAMFSFCGGGMYVCTDMFCTHFS